MAVCFGKYFSERQGNSQLLQRITSFIIMRFSLCNQQRDMVIDTIKLHQSSCDISYIIIASYRSHGNATIIDLSD